MRVAQTIPCSFDGKNPYTACPFYMTSFFMWLELGRNISAIIPLDARNLGKSTSIVVKPVFLCAPEALA
jgi:hypothetical protein